MKRKMFVLVMALIMCLSAGLVNAASVSLELTPQDVAPGASFTLDMVYDFTDGGVTIADTNIIFDDTALSLQSFSWDTDFEALWDYFVVPTNSTPVVSFAAFNPLLPGASDTGTIGTLTFELAAGFPVGNSTTVDLSENLSLGGWFNGSDLPIDPSFTGATINAVPIPGAFLLLGSGLIGLIGLRKKLS